MTDHNIYIYGNYNHYKGDTREEQNYWPDAISCNCQLEKIHFGRKHKYRLEWDVPGGEMGTGGCLRWFFGRITSYEDGWGGLKEARVWGRNYV